MADYRTFFDSQCLFAYHLQGRDVTLTISKVTGGELTGQGGKKTRKPMVYFAGKEKPLAINKTNGKSIAAMYGPDTAAWIGKRITIYPTTTQFGSETHDCIRVRPGIPKGKENASDLNEGATPPDPNQDGRP